MAELGRRALVESNRQSTGKIPFSPHRGPTHAKRCINTMLKRASFYAILTAWQRQEQKLTGRRYAQRIGMLASHSCFRRSNLKPTSNASREKPSRKACEDLQRQSAKSERRNSIRLIRKVPDNPVLSRGLPASLESATITLVPNVLDSCPCGRPTLLLGAASGAPPCRWCRWRRTYPVYARIAKISCPKRARARASRRKDNSFFRGAFSRITKNGGSQIEALPANCPVSETVSTLIQKLKFMAIRVFDGRMSWKVYRNTRDSSVSKATIISCDVALLAHSR